MIKLALATLLLFNLHDARASGSESSSSGNTREKDSSKEEMRNSIRERIRTNRLKEKNGQAEENSQAEKKEVDSTKEEE